MNTETGNGSMRITTGVIIQLVVIIVGLGVAWGSVKSQMTSLESAQLASDRNQAAIFQKLEKIDRNMVRIGVKMNLRLEE